MSEHPDAAIIDLQDGSDRIRIQGADPDDIDLSHVNFDDSVN